MADDEGRQVHAEKIADEARNSISTYCFTECNAYCCRTGFLLLSSDEAKLLKIDTSSVKTMPDGRFAFSLKTGCPLLEEFKCKDHNNNGRPLACREFPIFIEGDKVLVAKDCPATEQNMLYPYLSELKKIGFSIVYVQR